MTAKRKTTVTKKNATTKKRTSKATPKKKAPAKRKARSTRSAKASPPECTEPTVEKALRDGTLAKIELYQGYVKRIRKGEKLRHGELLFFKRLEDELYKESENGANGNSETESGEDNSPLPDRFEKSIALEYLGISKRSLSYHVGRGNIRQNPDGSLDRVECDRFLFERGRQAAGGKNQTAADYKNSLAAKIQRAELRWRIARARREENLNAELEKRLFSRKEAAEAWAARVRIVCSGLETFADRLPPILEGKSRDEIKEIIRDEVRRLREAYVADGKYCPKPES